MKKILIGIFILLLSNNAFTQNIIAQNPTSKDVSITNSAAIYIDSTDDWLVAKSAAFLQKDMQAVTGNLPSIITTKPTSNQTLIIIGTANNSSIIKQLIQSNKFVQKNLL